MDDGILQDILQGDIANVLLPPTRIIKVVVLIPNKGFDDERKQIKEAISSELKRFFSPLGLDIDLIDILSGVQTEIGCDPYMYNAYVKIIKTCLTYSTGPFLLCFLSNASTSPLIPLTIPSERFNKIVQILAKCGEDSSLLKHWYQADESKSTYQLSNPCNKFPELHLRKETSSEWNKVYSSIVHLLKQGTAEMNVQSLPLFSADTSGFYSLLQECISLSDNAKDRIICVTRTNNSSVNSDQPENVCKETKSLQIQDIKAQLNENNFYDFRVEEDGNGELIVDIDNGIKKYADELRKVIIKSIKNMVKEKIQADKTLHSYLTLNRTVQEVIVEAQTHLHKFRKFYKPRESCLPQHSALIDRIGPLLQDSATKTRNTPLVLYGKECTGKTTLLSMIFKESETWLGRPIFRIVRQIGTTPQSSYPAEILRSLCHHITLAFGFEALPKRFSYDFGRLCIWFQDLLKHVETTGSELLIVLDDINKLRVPNNNKVSIFGWIPWNLPSNVHIVITILESETDVLNLARTKVSGNDCFIKIDQYSEEYTQKVFSLSTGRENRLEQFSSNTFIPLWLIPILDAQNYTPSQLCSSNINFSVVNDILEKTENQHGRLFVERICLYITYSCYGLTESEIADLLSVEESSKFEMDDRVRDEVLAIWPIIRSDFDYLLVDEYLDGKIYTKWLNETIVEIVKERYSANDWTRKKQVHVQLSKYFLLAFIQGKDNWKQRTTDSQHGYQVPDIRCIEELWSQLLKAGDFTSLKKFVVCSYHFLLASLSAMSVSYVRSLLELVRYKVLHWELEVILNIMKLSVDVLSCDPYQLSSEIVNWLSPFTDGSSNDIQSLVAQARDWNQSYSLPILNPYSSWLNFTLPQQATSPLTTEDTVDQICVTRDNQKVICTRDNNEIYMYHISSKQKEYIFTGHKNRVTCLHISYNGKVLVSGSEDTTVLVWSINSVKIRYVISEHIAGLMSVTTTHNDNLIISGCAFGTIVISQLRSGELVQKIEHHRGSITCVKVNQNDDILVTGSSDHTICLWSLDDYSFLNSVRFDSQVTLVALSSNNIFLLVACSDETVHVKSLTTGSDIHRLDNHPSQEVTSLCCAYDNSRAVVGCVDGKIYIYDIHSSQMMQTLSAHLAAVTSIQITTKDHFMVSAGGDKVVVWNFAANAVSWMDNKTKQQQQTINHDEAITCASMSRDGSLAATGGKDSLMKVWQVSSSSLNTSFHGHTASVTCLTFSRNGLYVVSGSEDKTLRVWGLTLSLMLTVYQGHEAKITNVAMTGDGQRVVSSDSSGMVRLWLADNGADLTSCQRPGRLLSVFGGMAFMVGGKSDNTLRMWPLCDPEAERTVSHMESIMCYTTSYDMKYIITGSQDMSLKVWEARSCKLTQVLAGHDGTVTCVAVSPLVPSLVVSGSIDFTVIVWDMLTGSETHTLNGHSSTVNCVKLTVDGSTVISGSSDNMVMLWSTKTGQRLTMFDLHSPVANVFPSLDAKYLVVQLEYSKYSPVLSFLNSPVLKKATADFLAIPLIDEYRNNGVMKVGPTSERRRRLGREQSVDWERKSRFSATRCLSSLSLDDFSQLSPCTSQETLLRDPIHVAPFAHPKDKRYGVTPNSRISASTFQRPRSKMLLRQNTVNITLPESIEKMIKKEVDLQDLSKIKSASSEAVNVSDKESSSRNTTEADTCSIC